MKDRGSPARDGRDRFVLRYRGSGKKEAADLGARLRADAAVTVVDEGPGMLLVEAPEPVVERLVHDRPGWTMSRETTVELPRARPRVRRPAH
jgi:hypothetical protein